jgi:2-polyprenyl-6-methoxyphenol hydroxylase-like FAD-dependent oxidoreductase
MAGGDFDVIVVGARVAGAATGMLLGRAGLRVLVVDQARLPSDTLSTHQIQLTGVARLRRWGLLDAVVASGAPPARRIRLDNGEVVIDGTLPRYDGVDAIYSPRRTVLDAILLDAARAAGVEVRLGYPVRSLAFDDAGRVTGIVGRGGVVDRARLVVGADGKRSTVAEAVGSRRYRQRPPATLACYTYWSGVPLGHGELYQRPGRAAAAFPTNDGLTMVYVAAPLDELTAFRADAEASYLASLDRCGDLGTRVRAGRRVERLRLAPDLPQAFRVPYGPGWALVGDAGLVMDPVSAQGIGNALCDAERVAGAIVAGLGGGTTLDGAASLDRELARARRLRDATVGPMYDFTAGLARLRPAGGADRRVLAAVSARPDEVRRFLGVFSGVESLRGYRTPGNALRLLGPRGVAGLAGDLLRAAMRVAGFRAAAVREGRRGRTRRADRP